MGCCFGKLSKTQLAIMERLQDVHKIFPGTLMVLLIRHDGEIIASTTHDKLKKAETEMRNDTISEDLRNQIVTFKRTANKFGATVNHTDCPVIHMRGNNTLFSCYDVNKNVLALYSQMHAAMLEFFDTVNADEKMQGTLAALRILINEHNQTTP